MHVTVGAILVEGIMRNKSLTLFEYRRFSGWFKDVSILGAGGHYFQ